MSRTPTRFKLPSQHSQVAFFFFFFLSPSFNVFACQECCVALATSNCLCAVRVCNEPTRPTFWTANTDSEDETPDQEPDERSSVSLAVWGHIQRNQAENIPAWATPFEHVQDGVDHGEDERDEEHIALGDILFRIADGKEIDAVLACCLPDGVLACVPYRCRGIQLWSIDVVRGNRLCVYHVHRSRFKYTVCVVPRDCS